MGAPVGSPEFCASTAVERLKKPERGISRLHLMKKAQSEYHLLRYCASGAFTHILRRVPPEATEGSAQRLDDMTMSEQKRIFAIKGDMPAAALGRATLRLSKGGTGILLNEPRRSPQFVDAWASSLVRIVQHFPFLQPDLDRWAHGSSWAAKALRDALSTLPDTEDPKSHSRKFPGSVRELFRRAPATKDIAKRALDFQQSALFKQLYEGASKEAQAHMVSCSGPGASAFLSAIGTVRELNMSNAEFTMCGKMYLDVDRGHALQDVSRCVCRRSGVAPTDYHLDWCAKCGNLMRTHTAVVTQIKTMLRYAGAYVAPGEPRGLPGFGQGGGDILVDSAIPGIGSAIYDFTAIHVKQPALLGRAHRQPLSAAKHAERVKAERYELHARNLGKGFGGLVIESGGAMGGNLQQVVRAACEGLSPPPGLAWSAPTAKHYFVQAISVAFWRAKAQGQLLLARAIRNNHATGFHDDHDGWTWEECGDFTDPFGDRGDPFEPEETGESAQDGGRLLLEDGAYNAGDEEEEEVENNPGLENPNKFGPGFDHFHASKVTSVSAGGRVHIKQERQEQRQWDYGDGSDDNGADDSDGIGDDFGVGFSEDRQQEERQRQAQVRHGGGAPGAHSPYPILGRGFDRGGTVDLMDDARKDREDAAEFLKGMLGISGRGLYLGSDL